MDPNQEPTEVDIDYIHHRFSIALHLLHFAKKFPSPLKVYCAEKNSKWKKTETPGTPTVFLSRFYYYYILYSHNYHSLFQIDTTHLSIWLNLQRDTKSMTMITKTTPMLTLRLSRKISIRYLLWKMNHRLIFRIELSWYAVTANNKLPPITTITMILPTNKEFVHFFFEFEVFSSYY